jgi:hypothetical protein
MELDAFRTRLGVGAGRITPANAPAGFDTVLFVLGDDAPGWRFDLAQGDHAEVDQSTDLTGVTFVRAQLALRSPADLPSGLGWEASILIDGVRLARAVCAPGKTRLLNDLAANVSKMAGVHLVGVRVELVGV